MYDEFDQTIQIKVQGGTERVRSSDVDAVMSPYPGSGFRFKIRVSVFRCVISVDPGVSSAST